jgi:predicted ATP-dependent endonuclease of OLD family
MYYIDSAEIEGFWGDRKLVLNFHQDVNFIIGVNGSGKTTLVNLLVAALSADFSELQRIEFTRLSIKLQAPGQRKCPLILITKSPKERTIFSSIKYEIKESSRAKSIVVPLDEYQDQMRRMGYPRHLRERELYRQQEFIAIEPLRRLVNTSWLSVHRFNIAHVEEHSRERYLSTVDKKLEELANRLVRYFSALGKSGSEIIESFQKEVFLAMLHLEKEKEFFLAVKNINIDSEKLL